MAVVSKREDILRRRIEDLSKTQPGSIGDRLGFQMVSWHEGEACTLRCQTEAWMTNFSGTLHGGIGAAVLDQAMSFVAFCIKDDNRSAPAAQLQTNFHCPVIAGEELLIRIHVVSKTHSLLHLSCEAFSAAKPEKAALSGSGIYFLQK